MSRAAHASMHQQGYFLDRGDMLYWFSKNLIRVATCWLIPALLMTLACGGRVMKVTKEEMEQRIKEQSPIGSSKDRVTSFLKTLNISGFKPEVGEYYDEKPIGTDVLEGRQNEVRGYLVAGIRRVGRDPSQFQVYNMTTIFYFDKGERLIAYRIEVLGDW